MKNLKSVDSLYLLEHDGQKAIGRQIEIPKKEEVFESLGVYLPLTLTSEAIILTEGPTESTVIPILLEKIGLNIENILVLPLGGDNIFHINPGYIKKIHSKCMVIIDSDLKMPIESGGSIQQKKLDYEKKCFDSGVEFLMNNQFRCIENMYPKETLAKVLEIDLKLLTYSNFDEIPEISDKISVGKKIAEAMDVEQARNFPYVKEIVNWLD